MRLYYYIGTLIIASAVGGLNLAFNFPTIREQINEQISQSNKNKKQDSFSIYPREDGPMPCSLRLIPPPPVPLSDTRDTYLFFNKVDDPYRNYENIHRPDVNAWYQYHNAKTHQELFCNERYEYHRKSLIDNFGHITWFLSDTSDGKASSSKVHYNSLTGEYKKNPNYFIPQRPDYYPIHQNTNTAQAQTKQAFSTNIKIQHSCRNLQIPNTSVCLNDDGATESLYIAKKLITDSCVAPCEISNLLGSQRYYYLTPGTLPRTIAIQFFDEHEPIQTPYPNVSDFKLKIFDLDGHLLIEGIRWDRVSIYNFYSKNQKKFLSKSWSNISIYERRLFETSDNKRTIVVSGSRAEKGKSELFIYQIGSQDVNLSIVPIRTSMPILGAEVSWDSKNLFLIGLRNGSPVLEIYDFDPENLIVNYQSATRIPTEGIPRIAKKEGQNLHINVAGMSASSTLFIFNMNSKSMTKVVDERMDPNLADIITEKKMVEVDDGSLIPVFISYKRGTSFPARTILSSYGGFGSIVDTPTWNPMTLHFVKEGFVYVSAVLRGGGEINSSVHEDGLFDGRNRTIRDFQRAAEYLIEEGITQPKSLGITGSSNGGLLVLVAALQRPDLYGGVNSNVPVTDLLRFKLLDTSGPNWARSDYGDPYQSQSAFEQLSSISPLHNIPIDVSLPPMLVVTALGDKRVHPAHSFKFFAALTDTATQGGPFHLLVRGPEVDHWSGILDRYSYISTYFDRVLARP